MRIIGIQEFLSGYSIHNTRQNYYYSLLSYFCGVYPELQSLRDSKDPALETKLESFNLTYFTSNRNYQYDLVKFRDVLLVTKAPKTLEVRLAAVLCYMEENSVTFSKGFLRRLIPKGSSQAISDELIPSGEQLAKLCEYCSLLTKTVVLFMSSSGCRLGETLLIRLEELDLNHNPVRINLRAETTKTKHKRIVFISSEAKGVLQEWLTYREAWMVTASKQGHYKHPDDRRVFPIQQSSFLSIWATAVNRAGLGKRDQRTKRFLLHPHNLRKYFRTRFGGSPDICEYLLGHSGGGVYTRFDQAPEIVEKEYLKCEANLSIFEQSRQVVELKEQVSKQSEQTDILAKNLLLKNIKLEGEIESLHKRFDKLESEVITEDKIRAILFGDKARITM